MRTLQLQVGGDVALFLLLIVMMHLHAAAWRTPARFPQAPPRLIVC